MAIYSHIHTPMGAAVMQGAAHPILSNAMKSLAQGHDRQGVREYSCTENRKQEY